MYYEEKNRLEEGVLNYNTNAIESNNNNRHKKVYTEKESIDRVKCLTSCWSNLHRQCQTETVFSAQKR